MKGVVLAGGLGTRLYPLTHATNKHLLPVYDRPMIYYPIQTLVGSGVKEILVVTGGPHAGDFVRVLKNGKELGVDHLEYAYQENEGGISDAISLAEDFSDGENIIVILGDNTTDADLKPAIEDFKDGALVFLKKFKDKNKLKRFGVPVFDKTGKRIVKVEEKPDKPKSKYVQTGLYIYDDKVFDHIRKLEPSGRGELEVSDLNSSYAKDKKLFWSELDGFWSDAGTFESLFETNKYWANKVEL